MELIVIIAILAILMTIAFLAFHDYQKDNSPEIQQKIEAACKMSGKIMVEYAGNKKCMSQFDYCNKVSNDSEALKICMDQKSL